MIGNKRKLAWCPEPDSYAFSNQQLTAEMRDWSGQEMSYYILCALGAIILVAGLRLVFTRLPDDRSESQWWDEQR